MRIAQELERDRARREQLKAMGKDNGKFNDQDSEWEMSAPYRSKKGDRLS